MEGLLPLRAMKKKKKKINP